MENVKKGLCEPNTVEASSGEVRPLFEADFGQLRLGFVRTCVRLFRREGSFKERGLPWLRR